MSNGTDANFKSSKADNTKKLGCEYCQGENDKPGWRGGFSGDGYIGFVTCWNCNPEALPNKSNSGSPTTTDASPSLPSKVCTTCKQRLTLDSFYASKKSSDGKASSCSACASKRGKIYRTANALRIKKYQKVRRASEAGKAVDKAYVEANSIKIKAREQLRSKVRSGEIKRQPCEVCGTPNAHGHHTDYTKPLDVRWFCYTHHKEVHGGSFKPQRSNQ